METEPITKGPSLYNAVFLAPPLAPDVLEELMDERFRNRLHGRTQTYYDGCRGVLCRKAVRDRPNHKRNKVYTQPRERDAELEAVQNWHEYVRSYFRKPYKKRESVAS